MQAQNFTSVFTLLIITFFLLFTFAFQLVGYDFWNCIVEACLILLYFESQKSHKCIYSTNYCVHLVSNYNFIHICITAFQRVWVELLEPYYWSMFPIVVAKLAQQMKGGFHLHSTYYTFKFSLLSTSSIHTIKSWAVACLG